MNYSNQILISAHTNYLSRYTSPAGTRLVMGHASGASCGVRRERQLPTVPDGRAVSPDLYVPGNRTGTAIQASTVWGA
jgi:hypothetical protein